MKTSEHLCSFVNVALTVQERTIVGSTLGQIEHVLSYLEMMRESLEEASKETSSLRNVAVEEEVLIEAEAITKTCNSALKHARHVERILSHSSFIQPTRS